MQARVEPFEQHVDRYEAWFERHRLAYEAELRAVSVLLPSVRTSLEIGVGSGRFAMPLGVRLGIDPSRAMCRVAQRRGIKVASGLAEALPIRDRSVGCALIVTTICFLDDVAAALSEVRRVLKPGGSVVVGFVDRNSPLGRAYQEQREENVFYRAAEFLSVDEVVSCLRDAGFRRFASVQTIFRPLVEIDSAERVEDGYGRGSFLAIRGEVPGDRFTGP